MNGTRPHFILVPLLAQGHMIPMIDLGRLLAEQGALVTIITTPVNAARIRPTIDRVHLAGLPMTFIELPFPCAEAGLPEGCENIDLVPKKEQYLHFFEVLVLLRSPLEQSIATLPPATCMIADMCNYWVVPVAQSLKIPRLVFHGPSCFFVLCTHQIRVNGLYDKISDDYELFNVPDMPHPVEICKAHAPGWFNPPEYKKILEKIVDGEMTADGMVENTFSDIEKVYIDHYEKVVGKKVRTVGPLCVSNKDFVSKATRGNKAAVDENRILSFLDSKEQDSVIYISFGTIARNRPRQVIEIGIGIENSGQPFIWVIKEIEKVPEVEKWLAGGFEDRTRSRGMIIKGWAPQIVILSHPAVGGFLTHCGWNSTQEGIAAGVPMLTWPFFADQFCNERLIVEVLKIGVSLGVKKPSYPLGEDEVQVSREDIENGVRRLMDQGEQGEQRRRRARELSGKAMKALEAGGSSYNNLTDLIKTFSNHY